VNLARATVLVVDGSTHSLDVTCQILKGFGVMSILRASTVAEADRQVKAKTLDLVIVDPAVSEGYGFEFIKELRRSGTPNSFLPVVLTGGHLRKGDVMKARDTGANFVVAKPLSAQILLQRILWVARDPREFVDVGDGRYVGPDRRFKFEGPPEGSDGRRKSDVSAEIGAAAENISSDELDNMFKPQRVAL
jgi:CheY-like chemotaxis protein